MLEGDHRLPREREGGAKRGKGDIRVTRQKTEIGSQNEKIHLGSVCGRLTSVFRSGTFFLRAKASLPLVLTATLALGACMDAQYSREGATDEQKRADQAQCQAQVDQLMTKERAIVDAREATIGATDRMGRTQLPQQMAARSDRNRSSRLMENCMTARGWTASKTRPF